MRKARKGETGWTIQLVRNKQQMTVVVLAKDAADAFAEVRQTFPTWTSIGDPVPVEKKPPREKKAKEKTVDNKQETLVPTEG